LSYGRWIVTGDIVGASCLDAAA